MYDEKILNKIKNLLDLSNHNPNENEALAAALKAQELMAKYNVELTELEDEPESRKIAEVIYRDTGKHDMKKWRNGLANVVAQNFRCKYYLIGNTGIVFYGYEEDAKIALQVFTYLYNTGNKLAVKKYNECRNQGQLTRGVMNTYLVGFRDGVKSALEKQCTALMIVVPQEVKDGYAALTKGFAKTTTSVRTLGHNNDIYTAGKADGRDAAQARSLAG